MTAVDIAPIVKSLKRCGNCFHFSPDHIEKKFRKLGIWRGDCLRSFCFKHKEGRAQDDYCKYWTKKA